MSSTQEVGEIFGEGSGPAHAMLRSPTVLIASVGLWGMNVYFFRLFGINYVRVLKYDLIVLENEDYERQVKAHEKQQHHQQQIEMRERNGSGGSNSSGGSGGGSSNNPGEIRSSAHGVGNSSSSEQTASSSSTGAHSRGGSLKVERLASNPSMLKAAADTLAAAVAGVRSPPGDSDGGPGGGGGSCVDPKKVTPTSAGANGSSKIRDGKPLLQSDRDPYSSDDEDLLNEDSNNNGDGSSGETPRYAAVTWERLVVLSLSLLFLLHSTYYMWIDVLGGGQLGAVFAFYLAVVVAIAFPLPTTRWLRKATVLVLQRSFELINPRCSCVSPDPTYGPRPIPFVDVFFADAMCSLSKVFFDWGMLLHMASHYPDPVPPAAHNILMPSAFAAMPFCIRARQCLLMYNVGRLKCDPKRFSHLWNALKYATSIFPLLLSAYQKTIDPKRAEGLEAYLIILITINAAYALYWDIVSKFAVALLLLSLSFSSPSDFILQ